MTTLFVLCLDLRCFSRDIEAHQLMMESLKNAVMEFAHCVKAFKSMPYLSILVLTEEYKPSCLLSPSDVLELSALYAILAQIQSHPVFRCNPADQDSGTLTGLQASLAVIKRFKLAEKDSPVSPHLVFVSPYCPLVTDELKFEFKEFQTEGVSVDFLLGQVMSVLEAEEVTSVRNEEIRLRTDLSDFAVLCMHARLTLSDILGADAIDFSLVLAPVEKAGFARYLRNLLQQLVRENSPVKYATIRFKSEQNTTLKCSIEEHLFYHLSMDLTSVSLYRLKLILETCTCHGSRINTFPHDSYYCSTTLDKLDLQDISSGFRFGESKTVVSYLTMLNVAEDPECVSLVVDKICPLSSVSEGLLFGNPVVLSFNVAKQLDWESFKENKFTFFSLCKRLATREEGIVVHSKRIDLHGQQSCPFVKRFYLLLPAADGCHFLARPLAVQEHLLPPLPVSLSDNDIPATIEDKVNALLAQVPVENFDPTLFSTDFHSLQQLIQEGQIVEKKNKQKQQQRVVRSSKLANQQPKPNSGSFTTTRITSITLPGL